MRVIKVGSSLTTPGDNHCYRHDLKTVFTPLIRSQQFLLVPNLHSIQVLSLKNGSLHSELTLDCGDGAEVNTAGFALLPNQKKETSAAQQQQLSEEDNNAYASSSSSSSDDGYDSIKNDHGHTHEIDDDNDSMNEEWVILAGCTDGKVREWTLQSLVAARALVTPRRTFEFSIASKAKMNVTHLVTCPYSSRIFALLSSTPDGEQKKGESIFVRATLPSYDSSTTQSCHCLLETTTTIAILQKGLSSLGHKNGITVPASEQRVIVPVQRLPFSLLSTRLEHNVIVVLVSTRGFYVHCESIDTAIHGQQQQKSLVHFPKDNARISTAAIAPNGKDLAIGYRDGKIDILINVLELCLYYEKDAMKPTNGNATKGFQFPYNNTQNHPRKDMVVRTIHWHSLPVQSLSFIGHHQSHSSLAASNLLSGGEEAVLVTWNLEQGFSRATHTLPRIAKGCIRHICTNDHSMDREIVVSCMDNTLQLLHGHNHAVRWKIQGLATSLNEVVPPPYVPNRKAIVVQDPKTQLPILTRLQGAPGFLHWYDPQLTRVVGELEVAPYNRISRKEPSDATTLPRPIVTHFVISKTGNELITVDSMLTEITSVGSQVVVGNDGMAFTTTLKFWSWSPYNEDKQTTRQKQWKINSGNNRMKMPYVLASAKPAPHGLSGKVDSLAMSLDGTSACTMSQDEGAFRVWGSDVTVSSKTTATSLAATTETPPSPLWKCLYKISTCSGFANTQLSGLGGGLSFSEDGSVLAVAYGNVITLWDHVHATLLHTLNTTERVKDALFIMGGRILTVSSNSIASHAPFGPGYLGEGRLWLYTIPSESSSNSLSKKPSCARMELGLVTYLPASDEIAIAITMRGLGETKSVVVNGETVWESNVLTRITIVHANTGEVSVYGSRNKEAPKLLHWEVMGCVESMCDFSRRRSSSDTVDNGPRLLILTDRHEMIVLESSDVCDSKWAMVSNSSTPILKSLVQGASEMSSIGAPILPHTMGRRNQRKNRREMINHASLLPTTKKRAEIHNYEEFGSKDDEKSAAAATDAMMEEDSVSMATSNLPALSGAFTRSFVERKLKKRLA